jgi:DNA processing protein
MGTNRLIQEGAKVVLDYADILEELNRSDIGEQLTMQALLVPTDETEETLLSHIAYETVHINEVGRPMTTVSSTLAMMELKGYVKQVGRMNYLRIREVAAPY